MRHLRERNLYLIVFNGLSYGQPIFIYIAYVEYPGKDLDIRHKPKLKQQVAL